MEENSSNLTIPVKEFPAFLVSVEKQINNEIRQIKEQIKVSRELRCGFDHRDENYDDQELPSKLSENGCASIELMNTIIALLDQSVRQYNQAMALEAEAAAAVLQDVSNAVAKNQLQGQKMAAQLEEMERNRKTVTDTGSSSPTPTNKQSMSIEPTPCMTRGPKGLHKGGVLLKYGKEIFVRSFTSQYMVVSDGRRSGTIEGIAWYDKESSFTNGKKPVDFIPFYVNETNSRGSRFKKAAVCWPLITKEECPKVTSDQTLTYFGIDYYNEKSKKNEIIVLAAESAKERDEWVYFITTFIALYIPPGEEFIQLSNMKLGCGDGKPIHISGVIDGEAPGSSQRVFSK
eukprot:Tbor_TRINITY_DN3319_c0_g1::TRINITY_DN3319_c0_g1_i1::g.23565::m.23565